MLQQVPVENLFQNEFIIKNQDFKPAVDSLKELSNNNIDESSRLIYISVVGNRCTVFATDQLRDCSIELDCTGNFEGKFAVVANSLSFVLEREGNSRIEVHESHILLKQGENKTHFPTFAHDQNSFTSSLVEDEIALKPFLKIIETYEKYLISKGGDSELLIFAKNNVYARNRLFYLITPYSLKKQYIFEKKTCKMILKLMAHSKSDTISLSNVDDDSYTILRSGNISMKLSAIDHEDVNLTKLLGIKPLHTYLVDRAALLDKVQKINRTEDCADIDILVEGTKGYIRPKKQNSLTEYVVNVEYIDLQNREVTNPHERRLSYTVNGDAMESVLKGITTERIMVSSCDSNLLLLQNLSQEVRTRYYVSIF